MTFLLCSVSLNSLANEQFLVTLPVNNRSTTLALATNLLVIRRVYVSLSIFECCSSGLELVGSSDWPRNNNFHISILLSVNMRARLDQSIACGSNNPVVQIRFAFYQRPG